MQLAFSWWQLFDVLLSILWLISGIRDFMGKDPLIRLPFNQYERDPEYRAFWQKKNGVLFTFNAVVSLLDTFLPQAPWGGSWLLVAVVVETFFIWLPTRPGSTAMTERVQKIPMGSLFSSLCFHPPMV